MRFEVLNKDNYETWKIQMCAVLIKNDMWGYVNGSIQKPAIVEGDPASVEIWTK